jgi:protein-S-isoprenylcysteine O-methyltransferase Ste14
MAFFHKRIWKAQIKDALIYWIYIPAGVILGGKTVDRVFSVPLLPDHFFFLASGTVSLILGLMFIQRSMKDLALYGDGTPNPLAPPKRLVTEGSYRLCRHPMFFGYNMAALGVALFLRSPGVLFLCYPVFIFFEISFLRKEERKLERRFPGAFQAYRERTPFLVPFVFRRRAGL